MTTRPLDLEEFQEILRLLREGFTYLDENNVQRKCRPNPTVAVILQLQANLGLRIGDVLTLRVGNFKFNRLEIIEQKTEKLLFRKINPKISGIVMEYALENNLTKDDLLFDIGARNVQKQLKKVTDYLGILNVSTHSFRKFYATRHYELSDYNIELVKELLNHKFLSTTQKYIRVSQKLVDEASEKFFV